MKYSNLIAIMALLAPANAIDISSMNTMSAEVSEATRYIGSNGKPINLAQSKGHARITLTQVKKYDEPVPIDNAMLLIDESQQAGCGKQSEHKSKVMS